MRKRLPRTTILWTLAAVVVSSACNVQSPLPLVNHNGSPNIARPFAMASPTATPSPSSTPIQFGGSMGIQTWPDGDSPTGGQGRTVDGLGCDKHMSTYIHIHVHLDVFDSSGRQLQMPWAIGIVAPWTFKSRPAGPYVNTGKCYYDLHSHDRDGVIHYEATDHTGLTLGNFFDVWGMPLSQTDVAGLTGTVWVMYGTKEPKHMTWSNTIDPRTIPLVEHEYIELAIDNPPKPLTLPVYRWTY